MPFQHTTPEECLVFHYVSSRFSRTPLMRPQWILVVFMSVLLVGDAKLRVGIGADEPSLKPLPKFLRTPAIAEKYLRTRDVAELLQFERAEPVCLQLVQRPHVPQKARQEALDKLASLRNSTPTKELMPWVRSLDQKASSLSSDPTKKEEAALLQSAVNDLSELLPQQALEGLRAEREAIVTLVSEAQSASARQAAFAAWILADQTLDTAWQHSEQSGNSQLLADLLLGTRFLPAGNSSQEALKARLRPLLQRATQLPVAPASNQADPVSTAAIQASGWVPQPDGEMMDALVQLIQRQEYVDACVQAFGNISPDALPATTRQTVAEHLVRYLQRLPLEARSQQAGQNASHLIQRLASTLPDLDASKLLSQLERIAIRKIELRAVEEKMMYDVTVIVVNAGQPVQLDFHNSDIMPHNLVLVANPAAREEIGMAADRMQNEPDALARGYLPISNQILHATKLLQPNQREQLIFQTPEKPGAYPYLCTFPGHWSRMYGVLLVVDDAKEYLAKNAVLPSADDLLGIRTVQWNEQEVAAALSKLDRQPSHANGQRAFQRASCFSCHQIRQEGGRVGPDLTKIREKYPTHEQLLHQILNPSEKIEPQYASVLAETTDGQVVRGVVVKDTDTELYVRENPLDTCEPRILKKDQIEELTRSPVSPMPESLLNTLLTVEDIHDLLDYILLSGSN